MVSASYALLLALVLARLAGASDLTAANVGLVCRRTRDRDDSAQGPHPDPPALKSARVGRRALTGYPELISRRGRCGRGVRIVRGTGSAHRGWRRGRG
jgi:hypothetical protein